MKIAVATMDGKLVSNHFGRSQGFVVFEAKGTSLDNREYRTNNHTPHAQGLCHGEGHEHGHHSHAGILDLLHDCDVVLCGGMGTGALQALHQNGIKAVIMNSPSSAEEAAASYLSGTLAVSQNGTCGCGH